MRPGTILLTTIILGSPLLQAQTTRKPAPAKASTAKKKPEKFIADFGITPRALGTTRSLAGAPNLVCWEWHIQEVLPPGQEPVGTMPTTLPTTAFQEGKKLIAVYSLQRQRVWEGLVVRKVSASSEGEHFLRIAETPQVTEDRGKTWVNGERGENGGWRFVLSNSLIELLPADEALQPVEFKAMAFQTGAPVAHFGGGGPRAPYRGLLYHSAVVAMAIGKNEFQGLVVFPGAGFTVPLHGVRVGTTWLAGSTEQCVFTGEFFGTTDQDVQRPGLWKLGPTQRSWWQFTDKRVVMGVSARGFDPGLPTDVLEQWDSGIQWDIPGKTDLTALADSFKTHFTEALWCRTDDPKSFCQEAETAYGKAGLTAHLPQPTTVRDHFSDRFFALKKVQDAFSTMAKRLEPLGIKVSFDAGK